LKTGPKCQVCSHPERWRVELLRAGGASLDSLATKFGLSRDAIHRHWQRHVSDEVKASYLAGPAQLADLANTAAAEGASVLDHFRVVRTMLMSQLALMTEAGDGRGAAIVAAQLTSVLEKIGKVTGEIATIAGSTINIQNNVAIINSPAFAKVQAAILRALAPHGAARAAVVAALQELDAEATDSAGARPIESRAHSAPLIIEAVPLVASIAPPPY
jgi:hypothetical protein